MKKFLLFILSAAALSLAAEVDLTRFKKSSNTWSDAFARAAAKDKTIKIPQGKYTFNAPLTITSDLRLIFAEGAHFHFTVSPAIILKGGTLRMESSGAGALITSNGKFTGFAPEQRGAMIDLNSSGKDPKLPPASLIMRNMELRGAFCVDGSSRRIRAEKIGAIDLEKCRFVAGERGIDILCPVIESVRVVDCRFTNGNVGMQFNAAIPGGAYVCGNILRNIGRSAIMLGKGGQIAQGCTTHLPNAIVHGNQILKGGHGATTKHTYIHGILIYGHNVSVQGNIVRDFHRGVPVPGAKCGHHLIENGKIFRERTQTRNGKRVRLAGSAIYLKANRAVVHSNICTNSGWRSVIEIKTGGKEYYTSVVNNVVDGKALAIDESFAFECNSGRSLWANNIVYDVPHQAFVVRSGYENSFMNNLIINAKVGFALSGRTPGQNELINGNRFIDVPYPVALDGKTPRNAGGLDVHFMPPSHLDAQTELPVPSQQHAGRMIVKGSSIYYCVNNGKEFLWMELSGKAVPQKKWRVIGPELVLNADQSGKDALPDSLKSPVHPGWSCSMRTANERPLNPADGHITFDTKNFLTGGRSLKFLFKGTTGEFSLRQPLKLAPGKRYRATARVKGEEPRNWRLEVILPSRFSEQIRAEENQNWQTLTVDFTTPANSGNCTLVMRGSKTSEGKSMWLDSVSVRELQDASLPPPPPPRVRKTVGKELLAPFVFQPGKLPAKWNLSSAGKVQFKVEADNTLAFSTKNKKAGIILAANVNLPAGKSYRFALEMQTDRPGLALPSVKWGKTQVSGKAENSSKWQKCHVDFDMPAGVKSASLRVWSSGPVPGEFIRVRNLSLKELEK